VYKQSPFYPFHKEIRKKENEKKKNQKMVDELYKKIKENVKEKMTDILSNDQGSEAIKALLGEYFINQTTEIE
jgi:parvulin-like peptidyl-prolyl isomerase